MSDDEGGGLMYRAFSVADTGEEYDPDIPPTSGNEYLRRVQLEAYSCPDVVVANLDTSKFTSRQTVRFDDSSECAPPPDGFAPPLEWQRQQVANFSATRQLLARHKALMKKNKAKCPVRLPRADDKERWRNVCYTSAPPAIAPLLSIVAAMPQHTVDNVINYNTQWIQEKGFCHEMGVWLYALLACLEKPLHPEACSNIRALARACASARRSLASKTDERLLPLNLVICLIARYFSQQDLADP